MIFKIWEKAQLKNLENMLEKIRGISEFCNEEYTYQIINVINEYINIFNDNYGKNRNPDTSLGGWIAVILDNSIDNVFEEYNDFLYTYAVKSEVAEVSECIVECMNGIKWILEIYIVSSDFGYVLLFPKKTENIDDL